MEIIGKIYNEIEMVVGNIYVAIFSLLFYGGIIYLIITSLLSLPHRRLKNIRRFKKFFNQKVRPVYKKMGIEFPEKLTKMNGILLDEVYVATKNKNKVKIIYGVDEYTHIGSGASFISPKNDTFPYTFFEASSNIQGIKKIVAIKKNWVRKIFQRSRIKVHGNENESLYIYGHYSNEQMNQGNKDFVNKYFKINLVQQLQKLPPSSQLMIKPNKIRLRLVGFTYDADLIRRSIRIVEEFAKLDFSNFKGNTAKQTHSKHLDVLHSIFNSIKKRSPNELKNISPKIKPDLINWINGFKEIYDQNDITTRITIEPNPTIEIKEKANKIEVKITGECEVEFQQKENSAKEIPAGISITAPEIATHEFNLIFDINNKELIKFEEDIWGEHYQ